jgi:HD-GYP domain-containing protein (c-di-GMP phosphodiesterase class II)
VTLKKVVKIHELIDVVVNILDARDPSTFIHSWRVAELSVLISENMGLQKDTIERIHIAAHLHDIGKIGVSDRVLNKMGKLNHDEISQMQAHPRIGYNIIKRLPILEEISLIVLYHHERFDGLGYPDGIKGEFIPLESRIISVVDAFDALSTDRPYRKAKNYDECFEEINLHAGSQFCPTVVRHFTNIRDIIPQVLDKFEKKEINHVAFVGHEELMHSRRLI